MKQSRKHRKNMLYIGIITAIVAAFAAVAYAADFFSLRSALIGGGSQVIAEPSADGETAEVTAQEISLAGVAGSAEYVASEEWLGWQEAYMEEKGVDGSWIDNYWTPADPALRDAARYYPVYNDEMLEKLVEIAEKYSLKLHSEQRLLSPEEFPGIFDTSVLTLYEGYCYEDGSFLLDGEYQGEIVQVLRNMAGTLPAASLQLWNSDENAEWSYTTAKGCTVDIMMSAELHRTKIFYADNGVFTIINAFIGDEVSAQAIADAIDFAALCR